MRLDAEGRNLAPVVDWREDPAGELGELTDLFDPAEEQEWQDRALCAQTDPEAFFPEKGGSTREAKRICQGCEVRTSAWSTRSPMTSDSVSGAVFPSASGGS